MYNNDYEVDDSNNSPSDEGGSDMAWSGGEDPPLHLSKWEQDSNGVYHPIDGSDEEEECR